MAILLELTSLHVQAVAINWMFHALYQSRTYVRSAHQRYHRSTLNSSSGKMDHNFRQRVYLVTDGSYVSWKKPYLIDCTWRWIGRRMLERCGHASGVKLHIHLRQLCGVRTSPTHTLSRKEVQDELHTTLPKYYASSACKNQDRAGLDCKIQASGPVRTEKDIKIGHWED